MRLKAWNRLLALGLSVVTAASLTLPAAAESVEYSPAEGVTHEIYWQKGVEAPALSGDKAAFKTQQVSLGDSQMDLLVAPYEKEKGWYDIGQDLEAELEQGGNVAAINLLYWWMDQNNEYIEKYLKDSPAQQEGLADISKLPDLRKLPEDNLMVSSALHQQLVNWQYPHADQLLDLFINGYQPHDEAVSSPDQFEACDAGGFFYPVFEKNLLTSREDVSGDAIVSAMKDSVGAIVTLKQKEQQHPVVIWGAETDENGDLAAIFATDSLDEIGMIRYDLSALEGADVTMEKLYLLDLGTAGWNRYEANGQPSSNVPTPLPIQDEDWGEPEYKWNEDYTKCTATRTDKKNTANQQTAESQKVTSSVTREATCTDKGQTTYKAEFEETWADVYEEAFDNIDATGHAWGKATYSWSDDYQSCTAKRVCQNNAEHTQSATAAVQKNAGSKGKTTYIADFTEDWAEDQSHVEQASGPSWGKTSYEWAADYSSCTAKRVDENDASNVETAKAKVTASVTREASCGKKGETTYKAAFTEDWAEDQSVAVENIDALSHDWGKTTYEWSEDHHRCTATRICKNDSSHVETARADVTATPNKKPTTTQKGQTKYVAEFREDWAENQTDIIEDIPVLKDSWSETEYQWSADYRKCTATRTNTGDSKVKETAQAKVTSKRTKEPTASKKGETTFTAVFEEDWAEDQTKTVANIPASGGSNQKPSNNKSWNAPTYEWSEDYSRCTARRSRKNDASTVETARAHVTRKVVQEPTCSVNGEAILTAEFAESWAEDQTTKAPIKPLAHELKKVAESEATAAHEGMKAHYECQNCHKLFSDAKGTKEVSREDLALPKPSVSDGYAIVSGVPEKDNLISVAPQKLKEALDQNPGAMGVSIAVGQITVSYDKVDVESILRQSGDAGKLQLLVYKTNATDSSLTLDQVQTMERNETGTFFRVVLSYVENGKNIPINNLTGTRITVPYSGNASVKAYQILEEGGFVLVTSTYQDGFAVLSQDDGLFMLSENDPVVGGQKKSHNIGMIIWIVVLSLSGLACLGLGGFFLYQKMQEKNEGLEGPSYPEIKKPVAPKPQKGGPSPWDPVNPAVPEDPAAYDGAVEDGTAAYVDQTFEEPPVSYDTVPSEMMDGRMPNQTVGSYQGRFSGGQTYGAAPAATDSGINDPELDALLSQADSVLSDAAAADAPKKATVHQPKKRPVSPTAPKAPMQGKPTIAQKTADAVNHEKHPKI